MSSVRVTIAVAVPAPLLGLALYFGRIGFEPESKVPADAIATMTFLAKDEEEARRIVAIAKRRLDLVRGAWLPSHAELIPQPFTPISEERLVPDTY